MLRECFCDTPRQRQYEKQLAIFLTESTPAVDKPIERVETRRRSAGAFQESYLEAVATGPAVFLVVGGVGAGKTTFVHRFFRFILDEDARSRTIWLYVDFTRIPGEEGSADEFATAEMLRELLDRYGEHLRLDEFAILQQVYEREISRMRKGPWAPFHEHDGPSYEKKVGGLVEERMRDHSAHLAALLAYLKRADYHVCIVLDNADQLKSEFQRQAILLAFQKARVLDAVVLLAIRDETYWKHRTLEPLDAYQSPVYYISPPTLEEMLSRRLQMLRREHGEERIELPSVSGVRFSGIKLAEFMGIVIESFLGEDRANLSMLEALAAQNMRRALDMFATFLSSGHTNTDDYIRTYMKSGSYLIPNHALIRSLALRDHRHYDSQRSHIANVYAVVDDGFYSHFNMLRVLRYLHERVHAESPVGQGFVAFSQMAWDLTAVCPIEERFCAIVEPLLRNALIEADTAERATAAEAGYLRVTVAGAYYYSALHNRFAYLDQVCTDTPIADQSWYEKLAAADVAANEAGLDMYVRMIRRVERVAAFLDYLRDAAIAEESFLAEVPGGDRVWMPDVRAMRDDFIEESNGILERAARYRDRRSRWES